MSIKISHKELLKAVREQSFIKQGVADCAVGDVYRFHLSGTMLKRKADSSVEVIESDGREGPTIEIKPGETLFVVTREILALSANLEVRLVPSDWLGATGIEILGDLELGHHYYGRVLIGLHNRASLPVQLRSSSALISGAFYDILGTEVENCISS